MKVIFITHPDFLGHQSMPRFARLLAEGMKERGHRVELWMPQPKFYNLPVPAGMRKWMGYLDQYILFPWAFRKRLYKNPPDTLYVFTDHALGPWVPLVIDLPHVIHCHDFLAQRSALNQIPENPIAWTGRQYQAYIRRGYTKGKNFISVSQKTKDDLHQFLPVSPEFSEVVYNGLNQAFAPGDPVEARSKLTRKTGINFLNGFLLHVGGNQWYKNRAGVIEIYNAWRTKGGTNLPLLMIGEVPDETLNCLHTQSAFQTDIHFISGLEDQYVRLGYAGAKVFLFPSKAEGFGWPIAEAMASGCPVITTDEAPMTEVAGSAAFLVRRCPNDVSLISGWASEAAKVLHNVLSLTTHEREAVVQAGLVNAKRFDAAVALDKIEVLYHKVLMSAVSV